MKKPEIQGAESWQECDGLQSQKPRYAVSEWFGRNPYSGKAKEKNLSPEVKLTDRHGGAEFARGSFKINTRFFGVCDLTALWIETQSRMDFCEQKITTSITNDLSLPVRVQAIKIVREFNERAERWRMDTSFQSSLIAKFMHDDYQTIMAMGEQAIPLILNRLKKSQEPWFWALKHLAKGYDAAEGIDNFPEASKAWLRWGQEKGYQF